MFAVCIAFDSEVYRWQHCLEWVMRVYTSKLTPDLFISWLWWLFCLDGTCERWSKYSTPQLTPKRLVVLMRVCAMFEGLTKFCFIFRFGFRSTLLDFTSRIERLHVCYYCADVRRVLAYFCSEYSRARPLTGRWGQVIDSVCMSQFSWREWPISCSRSTVTVTIEIFLLACCALMRNSLQTNCLKWVMTRYLTLDTMLEIGARK